MVLQPEADRLQDGFLVTRRGFPEIAEIDVVEPLNSVIRLLVEGGQLVGENAHYLLQALPLCWVKLSPMGTMPGTNLLPADNPTTRMVRKALCPLRSLVCWQLRAPTHGFAVALREAATF